MQSKSVINAIEILEVFTIDKPAWGLRELSREIGLNHSAVYRILKSFEVKGYIIQNSETKKYELGIKFFDLANIVLENMKIFDLVTPLMEKAAIDTGESVVLTVLDENEGIFLKIAEGGKNIKFAESVGRKSPLYIGASHKVILAHFPICQQRKIIQEGLDKREILDTSMEQFLEDLDRVKENGWIFTTGETYYDVSAVSVPLFDKGKVILGSLSIAGPTYRLDDQQSKKVLPILKDYQNELNTIFESVIIPTRRGLLNKE